MEYGKPVYFAGKWVDELVFSGTKRQIERKLKRIFLSTWVR